MSKERDGLVFISHFNQAKEKYEDAEFWDESQERMLKGFEALGLKRTTLPTEGLTVNAYGPVAQKMADFEKSLGDDFAWVIPKSLIEGANEAGFEPKEVLGVDLFAATGEFQYDGGETVKERFVYFYTEIAGIDHNEEESDDSGDD